ncbi:olfactory receptor 14I1-like [Elgaria multicarinata webbii]|uniref:olfactory receptor 14I1-like n=1 Tax=Elgaria multicarinata webbii TaxID=159646 RepID=UPI002FCD0C20
MDNQTSVSVFLLLEFSKVRELQIIHFILFLILYLATVTGNLLIIAAIAFDHHLHTPMYFFLMNLAMQDIGSVSVTIPKAAINSLMNIRYISYSGCVTQVLLFVLFVGSDIALLTVMAYDRYVAICNPLQYTMVMNKGACTQMVGGVWIAGLLNAVLHTGGTFANTFCSYVVEQFFCETPQLLKIACSDLQHIEIGFVMLNIIIGIGCFIFIIVSYTQIFTAVMKIPSIQGRKKAFSTCLPHLIVFSMFFVSLCFAYLRPTPSTASDLDLLFTIIYSILPSMLNPLIYSMRNKDIKVSLSRLFTSEIII